MNCAESQDLLLDLAYGELEPARAAEVEAHVAACAPCRAEKAQIDLSRRLAAPLRELEEPSANFDEPIVRAAGAEAGMQADGTPGPVVEVAATVKPLGLQAARLDPHARVRGNARQAPWWRRPSTIIGSTAAAAALAIAVSVSVTRQQQANRVEHDVAPITIRAPALPVPQAVDDALTKREQRGADEPAAAGTRALQPQPSPPPAAAAQKDTAPNKLARAATPQEPAANANEVQRVRKKEAQRADEAEAKVAQRDAAPSGQPPAAVAAKVAERDAAPSNQPPHSGVAAKIAQRDAAPSNQPPPSAVAPKVAQRAPSASEDTRTVADARAPLPAEVPSAATTGAVVGGVATMKAPAQAKSDAAARTADQIEDDASAARRAGDYARAAALYKHAAALRTEATPARAAWDMAHAVECLAAGGNVAEAVETRKELRRAFPDQQGPRAAADSALRTVPLPSDQGTIPPK